MGKSPAVWFAVAAAVVAGTVALADYVSGAKKAREALKGMQETADEWKNTAAETFYGSSEGLSFFGMSKDDFTKSRESAQDWLDGLLAVWSDGEKESNEIVAHWTDSFKTLTASTRDELTALKETADKNGYTSVSKGLAADIQTLDQMDAEIERLLKKRQNGFFSEKDQIRLQELIDTREAIEVKYHLTPEETGGFETIAQKVEAEVARAQARGKTDADVTVYENAVKAAAEGMAAINAQIDERYDNYGGGWKADARKHGVLRFQHSVHCGQRDLCGGSDAAKASAAALSDEEAGSERTVSDLLLARYARGNHRPKNMGKGPGRAGRAQARPNFRRVQKDAGDAFSLWEGVLREVRCAL